MSLIFGFILGILLTIQLFLLAYCGYWRKNNPWKWFSLKTITTMLFVLYIVHDIEMICGWDLIFCSIIAICVGIDFALTVINYTNKK